MGQFSLTHLLILAIIALIFFGPSRLPKLGQGLGRAIRGFKDGLNGTDEEARQNEPRSVGGNRSEQLHSPGAEDDVAMRTSDKKRDRG